VDPSLTSITSQFDPRLAALLAWVVLVVKLLVDWIKTATVLPPWAPPALAFLSAAILIPLLAVAIGIGMTPQLVAQAVVLALIATVLAIGVTAVQQRTLPSSSVPPEIDYELLAELTAVKSEEKRRERVMDNLKARAMDGIRTPSPADRG
jgi:hypothetical protein